jgi:hypothetical protein
LRRSLLAWLTWQLCTPTTIRITTTISAARATPCRARIA